MDLKNTILYTGENGSVNVSLFVNPEDNSMWATEKIIAQILDTNQEKVSRHLKDIFSEGELDEKSVLDDFTICEENRMYKTTLYDIDAIISVSYRIDSKSAIEFRRWAIKIISDYIIKGFILDKQLLENGRFGENHFSELLDTVQEIRAYRMGF